MVDNAIATGAKLLLAHEIALHIAARLGELGFFGRESGVLRIRIESELWLTLRVPGLKPRFIC